MQTLLLTSFDTWQPEQVSNASDDLLELVGSNPPKTPELLFLRKLPVDTKQASDRIVATLQEREPDGLVCCGMAAKRALLALEKQAVEGEEVLQAAIDLQALAEGLQQTYISYDAGRFVCNATYYQMLRYQRNSPCPIPTLFVHVPILNEGNRENVVGDFLQVLQRFSDNIRPSHQKPNHRFREK